MAHLPHAAATRCQRWVAAGLFWCEASLEGFNALHERFLGTVMHPSSVSKEGAVVGAALGPGSLILRHTIGPCRNGQAPLQYPGPVDPT